MNTQEQKSEVSKMVKIEPRYLMGTKAYHQLGEKGEDEWTRQAMGMTEEEYSEFMGGRAF